MFEAEALSLDAHFGHEDTEGPVTFVLATMLAAQRYGVLRTADIKAFLAALSFLRASTDAREFIEGPPGFKRCWASLKQDCHNAGDFVTDETRAYIINEVKAYPVGRLVHYDVNGHHRGLTQRLREYEFTSIERQAMRLALGLYEDILIHVALEHPVIREKINRAVKTECGNSVRLRMLAIHAESEARAHFNEWKPLRQYLHKPPTMLEVSP